MSVQWLYSPLKDIMCLLFGLFSVCAEIILPRIYYDVIAHVEAISWAIPVNGCEIPEIVGPRR